MEEAAKVIGGVTGELLFFARSFLLGFLLRLGYEPLILVRKLFRHPKLVVDVQDILFWTAGSFLMFGLLFRENNGTPRLFSLVGILAGMILYQLGPGRLTGALFNKLRRKSHEWKRIYQEKRKDRIQKRKDRIQKRKDRLQEQKVAARQRKNIAQRRKMEKKRLKKEQKDSMIKRQDEHSRNKRGEDSDRKNGSPQESQSQVDRTGTRDSDPLKRDDLDRRKQSGRAKRTEPDAAKAPRRADRKGRSAQRRT